MLSFSCKNNIFFEAGDDVGQNDYMTSLANPASENYDPRRWAQTWDSGLQVQGKIDSLESMKPQAGQNDYMMRMMDPASANYDPARWNQTMHSASQVQDRINSLESMNHQMNNLPQGASSNSHPLMNAANNMQNSISRGMNNVGINKLGVSKF